MKIALTVSDSGEQSKDKTKRASAQGKEETIMSNLLEGKVAIVTGGTRGIGYAIVKKYLENGAKVVLFGSRQETVDKALASLKEENPAWEVEGRCPKLTDAAEMAAVIQEVADKFGRLDILVNNAGISQNTKLYDYQPEDFEKIMDLNVSALFYAIQPAAKIMKAQGGGVILNTSSMVSISGQPAGVGYPTSKFAVNGLTLSLARELGPDQIRVNAVAPGVTRTDMVAALPADMLARVSAPIPLRRIGEPEDIANAFLFLASDMASYVTGEVLSVDGAMRT
jgi:3-oxoacyl-[acyl-carrier protein] reductase/7-alpha-hydroxysteroid dehydrogenase